jgi:hypothetical protein
MMTGKEDGSVCVHIAGALVYGRGKMQRILHKASDNPEYDERESII